MPKFKRRTWSDGTEWEGFKPVGYQLDLEKIWNLPLLEREAHQKPEANRETTIGGILERLQNDEVVEIKSLLGLKITTKAGVTRVEGPSFHCQLLQQVLNLRQKGIDLFGAMWFWYDSDSVTDDPHDSYRFFLVQNDAIVAERIAFSDYRNNGFTPAVFLPLESGNAIWFRDNDWDEAVVRYWYRRFYKETRTGQLLALRPDHPELYFYPEGRWDPVAAFTVLNVRLERLTSLLTFLLVSMIVVIVLLWGPCAAQGSQGRAFSFGYGAHYARFA